MVETKETYKRNKCFNNNLLIKEYFKKKNDASKNGFVKNWAHIEKDEPLWLILVNNLGSIQT